MSPSKQRKGKRIEIYLFIFMGILAVSLVAGRQILLSPHSIATGDGSYALATNIPNQMKFVSPKLGISFLYMSKLNSSMPHQQAFHVQEVGNKVYLYDREFGSYTQGYSVEIFNKAPKDSFETAIRKRIL